MTSFYDALLRHSIYVEGVKTHQSLKFNKTLTSIDLELRNYFAQYDNFEDLSKQELNKILRDITKIQKKLYDKYFEQLKLDVVEFIKADIIVQKEIQKDNSNKKLWPLLALNASYLISKINNNINPATGLTIDETFDLLKRNNIAKINNAISIAWSNKESFDEALRSIKGSKKLNWKNGKMAAMFNANSNEVHTIFQSVSSIIQNKLEKEIYKRYIWISILDDRTTLICRGRHKRTYVYGKGPIPPAHRNCRSKIMPLSAHNSNSPVGFFEWLKNQPSDIQNKIIGSYRGSQLRNGKLTYADFPKFNGMKPISINEFKNSVNSILQ